MRKPYRIDAIIALVGPEVSGRGDGSEVIIMQDKHLLLILL